MEKTGLQAPGNYSASYPGEATPAHPQSRVSAKALEPLLKLFAMVCSTNFVLARRIGAFVKVANQHDGKMQVEYKCGIQGWMVGSGRW